MPSLKKRCVFSQVHAVAWNGTGSGRLVHEYGERNRHRNVALSYSLIGSMQGSEDKIAEMKKWLQETGSPASVIDHAVFSNEHEIEKPSFSDFQIHYESSVCGNKQASQCSLRPKCPSTSRERRGRRRHHSSDVCDQASGSPSSPPPSAQSQRRPCWRRCERASRTWECRPFRAELPSGSLPARWSCGGSRRSSAARDPSLAAPSSSNSRCQSLPEGSRQSPRFRSSCSTPEAPTAADGDAAPPGPSRA